MDFVAHFVSAYVGELALKVFSYLTHQELCACDVVSKSWKLLARHELLWKVLVFKRFAVLEGPNAFDEVYAQCVVDWKALYRQLLQSIVIEALPYSFAERRKATEMAGRFHTAVVIGPGQLVVWGRAAKWMALSMPADSSRPFFMAKDLFKDERVAAVSVHYAHFVALGESGDCYTWGRGENGELGHRTRHNILAPQKIPQSNLPLTGTIVEKIYPGGPLKLVNVSAGYVHMAAITEVGTLLTWGCSEFGRLGIGKPLSEGYPDQLRPVEPVGMHDLHFNGVSCGGAFTIAVAEGGHVIFFGCLCEFSQKDSVYVPTEIPMTGLHNSTCSAVAASAGDQHALVLTVDGRVFSWGLGTGYRLGHGSQERIDKPMMVEALSGETVEAVSAGFSHSVVCTERGEVFTWGWGSNGQLGHENFQDRLLPRRVDSLAGVRIATVSAGYLHTVAVAVDGSLYAWGDNSHGQLGIASPTPGIPNSNIPLKILPASYGAWWRVGHGLPLVV